jgi:hypothetical protein
MTETGIYDLQNINLIAVKMHSVRHPSAPGHAPNDMGILADISLLAHIPLAVLPYNHIYIMPDDVVNPHQECLENPPYSNFTIFHHS